MRAHLVQEPQLRHDPVVQINQFVFVEFVDVDIHDCVVFLLCFLCVIVEYFVGKVREVLFRTEFAQAVV